MPCSAPRPRLTACCGGWWCWRARITTKPWWAGSTASPPQLQRLPRGTRLAAALADSAAHARLAWFTDGVLRYDQIGEHLVVTDIRLGMTGVHPFRFNFATLQDGKWQVHEQIDRWPAPMVDFYHLQVLWQRIWQPELDVPLVAWASELEKPRPGATRQACLKSRDDC